jgi:hypothetical protein
MVGNRDRSKMEAEPIPSTLPPYAGSGYNETCGSVLECLKRRRRGEVSVTACLLRESSSFVP